jgi:hypothetical protein
MGITLEVADFNKTLERYVRESGKDMAQELNNRAFWVVTNAKNMTKAANGAAIRAFMQTERIATVGKSGKVLKKPRRERHGTLQGYKIYNFRRVKAGLAPLGGPAMSKPFKKFVNYVVKSCGYIRAGWIPAQKLFEPFSKGYIPGMSRIKRAGVAITSAFEKMQNKKGYLGGGTIAVWGASPMIEAKFWNSAVGAGEYGKAHQAPENLQKAIEGQAADMKIGIAHYLQKKAETMR